MIQRLRERAEVGAPGGCAQGDLVTVEGLAQPSPADPAGQVEGREMPKAEEQAGEVQIPEEEVDWTKDKPEEPKKRRKIRRAVKRQRKAEKETARKAKKRGQQKRQKQKPKKSFKNQSQCTAQLLTCKRPGSQATKIQRERTPL